MSRPHRFPARAAPAALFLALAATTAPQADAQSTGGEPVAATDPGPDLAEARALRAQIASLEPTRHNWRKLRILHEKAARVAPENDLERIRNLRQAGLIAFYLGDLPGARELLVRAARTARELGDVYRAGTAYLAAAAVTARMGDRGYALDLLERAERLAQSPLLVSPFCDCLRARVVAQLAGLGREAGR